jgi:hypothetical protein
MSATKNSTAGFPHSLHHLSRRQRLELQAALEEKERRRCAWDAEYWLFKYARTKDEHDPTIAAKPFPDKAYIRELVRFWLDSKMNIIEKSRAVAVPANEDGQEQEVVFGKRDYERKFLREILARVLGTTANIPTRGQLADEAFERFIATQETNATHSRELRTVFVAFLLDEQSRMLLEEGGFAELSARDASLYGSLSQLTAQERGALIGYLQSQVPLKEFERAA